MDSLPVPITLEGFNVRKSVNHRMQRSFDFDSCWEKREEPRECCVFCKPSRPSCSSVLGLSANRAGAGRSSSLPGLNVLLSNSSFPRPQ